MFLTPKYFKKEDALHIAKLGAIGVESLQYNSKRVANALHEILEIISPYIKLWSIPQRIKGLKELEKFAGLGIDDIVEELIIACLDTGQYHRGLRICAMLLELGLKNQRELASDMAEFHTLLNNSKKAEELLLSELEKSPKDIWIYISLGDIYWSFQIQDELQDLNKAELWYYKAYDLRLANNDGEDARVLLERLSDICIKKLRRISERKLLNLLKELQIGDWETLVQLRNSVIISGFNSNLLAHIQNKITVPDIALTNRYLDILTNAYNFMVQRDLDGRCPFEMMEAKKSCEHSLRIQREMINEFEKQFSNASKKEEDFSQAEFSDNFARFQTKFFKDIDPKTGKERGKLLDGEHKKMQKMLESGEYIWMGFLEYRDQNDSNHFLNVKPAVGRNEFCPCGSGKKYKKCHGQ